MERYKKYLVTVAAVVALLVVYATFISVRETEFVLITQVGGRVRTILEAGPHAKWFFQTSIFFDRRLRVYNPRPSEFLTRDKKNLVIENYVAWKIQNPQRFVETVGDPIAAEMRLHDIIWSGLSAALGTHDLDSIVSASPEKVQAAHMLDDLTALTDRAALEQYGINVVDVRIKRLNLPEQNKQSVYARIRAEPEPTPRPYPPQPEQHALTITAT